MATKIEIQTTLEEEICITCGIVFAIPSTYKDYLRKSHEKFYCPNGHNMYFPAKTREEELEEKLNRERQNRYRLESRNTDLSSQLDGALGEIRKMKKRANAGVCPYCRRHFTNVESHVQTKHKDKL